jgi:putative ABC transport system permease protein
MKIKDVIGYAFNAIKLRKLRSALTILGVVIGIAAVVALTSVTRVCKSQLSSSLNLVYRPIL